MISDLLRNQNDLLIGMQKNIGSPIHSIIVQIVFKRLTVLLPEQLSEIGTVDIIFLTESLKREVIRVVFPNLFLHISKHTSVYVLAELGKIISVLACKTHQM